MNLLLDTHALLWCLKNFNNLSRQAYKAIINPENRVFVSVISIAEIKK